MADQGHNLAERFVHASPSRVERVLSPLAASTFRALVTELPSRTQEALARLVALKECVDDLSTLDTGRGQLSLDEVQGCQRAMQSLLLDLFAVTARLDDTSRYLASRVATDV
jgi:hypothetical protein